MEKYGQIGRFSGRIWPVWGNTAQADTAGLGSIGLDIREIVHFLSRRKYLRSQYLKYIKVYQKYPYYNIRYYAHEAMGMCTTFWTSPV